MKDIELQARLEQLLAGKLPREIAARRARELTAVIRDRLAPLAHAATAIAKGQRPPGRLRGLGCPGVNLAGLGLTAEGGKGAVATAATGASIGSAVTAGAAAGSVVPVVGTVIGAAVGLIAGYLLSNKHYINVNSDNAEEDQDVLDIWPQYRKIAGQVAGRDIGLPLLLRIFKGAVYSQSDFTANNHRVCFHNGCLKYPGDPDWILQATTGANSKGQRTDNTVPVEVDKAIAAGVTNAAGVIDQFFTPSNQWARPSTPAGRQVLIDIADAWLAQKGFPYTYGTPQISSALPQAIAPAAPNVGVTPGTIAGPPGVPPQTFVATTPNTSTEDLLRAFLAQQGVNANSPQAQILLRDVGSGGVQMTPQGPAFAGFGGGGLPGWVLGGAALLALGFALMVPASSPVRSKAA